MFKYPNEHRNTDAAFKDSCHVVLAILGFNSIIHFCRSAGVSRNTLYFSLYDKGFAPRTSKRNFLKIVEALKSAYALSKPHLNRSERKYVTDWMRAWMEFCLKRERIYLKNETKVIVNPTKKQEWCRENWRKNNLNEIMAAIEDFVPARKKNRKKREPEQKKTAERENH